MGSKSRNRNLQKAKSLKNDEFYTQLSDIEKELTHYKNTFFKNKVVYCNCDDPRVSKFFHYFSYNFEKLGLKKLITTCYKSQNDSEKAIHLEYRGDKNNNNKVPDIEEIGINYLKGDGDFRSKESIELLKQADIVVTNPPFSLFREYVEQLMEYDKKFIIIGSLNAITYKEIFKIIKQNKLRLGFNAVKSFMIPSGKMQNFGNICWYTNLEQGHKEIILYKKYNEQDYPKYDNYDAINVNKIKEIPMDYKGAMGVPITFMNKYNPNQFEIIGINKELVKEITGKVGSFRINNKELYARIIIKNKKLN